MANTGEYGLFQLMDLGELNPDMTARTVDSGLLISAVQYDAAQHNADINALLGLFAFTTTDYQLSVEQQSARRNQPLDENGRSIPIKPLAPYTVGFPILGSGNAYGSNYVTSVRMTVRDLARVTSTMYRGDYQWVVDHVLAALFSSTTSGYTFRDPIHGDLTVQGLANGDTVTYYSQYTGGVATDTHYLAQANAIADGADNPYPIIASELQEHPSNGGEIIAFISSSLVATTEALTEFHQADLDPDITLGVNETRLTGMLGTTLPMGARLRGKTDSGVWIVEWPAVPSGYIVAVATDGPRPLARRQYPEELLQGFRPAGERNDWPYFENQWIRFEGYGGYNRTGAVAYRVGNASWAIPTNYGSPMP